MPMAEMMDYPRPPIIEAVVEFRLSTPCEAKRLLESVKGRLGTKYAGPEQQKDLIEVQASFQDGSISTTSSKKPHITFVRSIDNLRFVGCGDSIVSVHVLAPYPGWENFIEQAREAVKAIPTEVRAGGFQTLSVRYIDLIAFSATRLPNLSSYFSTVPQPTSSTPQNLAGFHWSTQWFDEQTRTTAALTMASAGTPEAPALFYDLNVIRTCPEEDSIHEADWEEIVEELHVRQRDIFEESITDNTRELFK